MARETLGRKRNKTEEEIGGVGRACGSQRRTASWELFSLGGAEAKGREADSRTVRCKAKGGVITLSVMGLWGKCRRSGHQNLFCLCPPNFLPVYYSSRLLFHSSNQAFFGSNFAPAAHSWGFIFQLVSRRFPYKVTCTRRCAFPPRLKVIVTPDFKKQTALFISLSSKL